MKHYLAAGLLAALLLPGSIMIAVAADPAPKRDQSRASGQEQVYGWELMTDQERAEHRAMMRSLKTEEERERYRQEHHQKMQERARERGVTLPEMPMRRGRGGRGPGGMGQGMRR